MCSPGRPQTRNPPALASPVLGMQAYVTVFGKMLRFSKVPLAQVWESRHWLEPTSSLPPPHAHRQVGETRQRVVINVLWEVEGAGES